MRWVMVLLAVCGALGMLTTASALSIPVDTNQQFVNMTTPTGGGGTNITYYYNVTNVTTGANATYLWDMTPANLTSNRTYWAMPSSNFTSDLGNTTNYFRAIYTAFSGNGLIPLTNLSQSLGNSTNYWEYLYTAFTGSHLIPFSNSTQTLGNSTNYWESTYINNSFNANYNNATYFYYNTNKTVGKQISRASYNASGVDETCLSATVLRYIPNLNISLPANADANFDCSIIFMSNTSTTGIGLAIYQTTAVTNISYMVDIPIAADGTASIWQGQGTSSNDTIVGTGVETINTRYIATIRGQVKTAAATTILRPVLRSEIVNTRTLVSRDSFCEYYIQ